MKNFKSLILIPLILAISGYAIALPPVGSSLEYDCIHQEFELKKHGNIYYTAYLYATVLEYQKCPPFSDYYKIPENETDTYGIVWGGSAIPDSTGGNNHSDNTSSTTATPTCADVDFLCKASSPVYRPKTDDPGSHLCQFGKRGNLL